MDSDVCTDLVTGFKHNQIRGHKAFCANAVPLTVPDDKNRLRQQIPQAIDSAVGPVLLDKGERGVENNDDNDGQRQLRHSGERCQARGYPNKYGESAGGLSHRQRELAPGLPWIGTVHNALSIHDWPYQERKEDYALFLGRFHQDKGAHLALDAAHAAGLPLVLAGKCAEPVEKDYFDREIRPRMTSSDHLYGMANVEEKRVLLAAARFLLFPIQWEEPFGMVLIEAMACGTPVIALRGGAVPEIVRHGETGLICEHPNELAEAIRQVHQISPAACRRRVTLRFNADRLASGYERAHRAAMAQTLAQKPGLSALAMQQ